MGIDRGPIQLKGRVTQTDFLAVACAVEQLRNEFIENGDEKKAEFLHTILQRIEAGNPSLAVNAGSHPQPQQLVVDGEPLVPHE